MPSWGAVAWGVSASGLLAAIAVRFLLRERRPGVLGGAALAALLGPLIWDLILRHTGGDFFVDAPGYVFPISFGDTGSAVFAAAIAALLLGFGPLAHSDRTPARHDNARLRHRSAAGRHLPLPKERSQQ
jgi:hypothetical protein